MTPEEAKRCIETLAAEVLALRRRLDELEHQKFDIHQHHHYPSVPAPNMPPWPQPEKLPWPQPEKLPWQPPIVWCAADGALTT